MESKVLNEYFKQLADMENKAVEFKKYLNSMRDRIKENEEKLCSLRTQSKRSQEMIERKSKSIPQTLTDLIFIETQNKTLCKQIKVFEEKISNLELKINEMNETRNQRNDEFVEKSFSFSLNYGFNGRLWTQSDVLTKSVEILQKKRNELKIKSQSVDQNTCETTLMEKNSLDNRMNTLSSQLITLQRDNSEWKSIEKRLKTSLKQLNDSENQELSDLRKKIQNIEEMETKEFLSEIELKNESQHPVIQISDSEDYNPIDSKLNPKSSPSLQVVVSEQNTANKSQQISNITENKRKGVKRGTSAQTDDEIWEILRQRNLRK